ncbi:MAG: flagellar export protein FliJ [Oscillospiraceae bacterium]|jgi:flagellar FliJ protein|nr:flagellar export protein FliJ [Oscillospiraceae bacterium]
MKKFKFTLQKVLEYRQQLLNVEQGKLSKINQRLLELEKSRNLLQDKIVEENKALKTEASLGLKITQYELRQRQVCYLISALDSASGAVLNEKMQKEEQRKVVVEANIDVKILEKLRERRLMEYNVAVAKDEAKMIDEFVANVTAER